MASAQYSRLSVVNTAALITLQTGPYGSREESNGFCLASALRGCEARPAASCGLMSVIHLISLEVPTVLLNDDIIKSLSMPAKCPAALPSTADVLLSVSFRNKHMLCFGLIQSE